MAVLDDTIPVLPDDDSGFGANAFSGVTLGRFCRVLVMAGICTQQQAEDLRDQVGFEMFHLGEE